MVDDPEENLRALEEVLQHGNLRSADRAFMRTMLRKLRRGGRLSYQERYNLWAYVSRYGRGSA